MKRSRNIRTVLFDFDGTLVDSSEVICTSFNRALEAFGLPRLPEDTIRPMIGWPLREMFRLHSDGQPVEGMIEVYRDSFNALADNGSRLLPGVAELIPRLAETRRLGIVTTRSGRGAAHLLDLFSLDSYFSTLVGSEHVTRCKPDPEPVLKALSILGEPPGSALFIGDTIQDMQAGLSAGTYRLGVTTGTTGADELRSAGAQLVLSTLLELSTDLDALDLDE